MSALDVLKYGHTDLEDAGQLAELPGPVLLAVMRKISQRVHSHLKKKYKEFKNTVSADDVAQTFIVFERQWESTHMTDPDHADFAQKQQELAQARCMSIVMSTVQEGLKPEMHGISSSYFSSVVFWASATAVLTHESIRKFLHKELEKI